MGVLNAKQGRFYINYDFKKILMSCNVFLSLSVTQQSRSWSILGSVMSVSWLWNIWTGFAPLCWPRCCCPPALTPTPRLCRLLTTVVSCVIPTAACIFGLFVKSLATQIIHSSRGFVSLNPCVNLICTNTVQYSLLVIVIYYTIIWPEVRVTVNSCMSHFRQH